MLDGCHFHITLPIDLWSEATVQLGEEALVLVADTAGGKECTKALAAVNLAMSHLGLKQMGAALSLTSPLPRGKGMASSTADVAAAIAATAAATGRYVQPSDIARLALHIEPTDGLMFPGLALFDHRDGRLMESLGEPPPMAVLVLEFAGAVDSVAFNRVDRRPALEARQPQWREVVGMVRSGIASKDVALIGQAASLDSLTYEAVVPRPELPALLQLAKDTGAAGVNIAHSGTVAGLLFPPDQDRLAYAAERARETLPGTAGLERAYTSRVVSGGLRLAGSQRVVSRSSAALQQPVR
jgi:L-threonine kinase